MPGKAWRSRPGPCRVTTGWRRHARAGSHRPGVSSPPGAGGRGEDAASVPGAQDPVAHASSRAAAQERSRVPVARRARCGRQGSGRPATGRPSPTRRRHGERELERKANCRRHSRSAPSPALARRPALPPGRRVHEVERRPAGASARQHVVASRPVAGGVPVTAQRSTRKRESPVEAPRTHRAARRQRPNRAGRARIDARTYAEVRRHAELSAYKDIHPDRLVCTTSASRVPPAGGAGSGVGILPAGPAGSPVQLVRKARRRVGRELFALVFAGTDPEPVRLEVALARPNCPGSTAASASTGSRIVSVEGLSAASAERGLP